MVAQPNLLHMTMKSNTRRRRKNGESPAEKVANYFSAKEWRVILKKVGDQVFPVNMDEKCEFPENVAIKGALKRDSNGDYIYIYIALVII